MVGDNWIIVEVPECWLVYLEYADESGYSNNEINYIDDWFRENNYKYVSAGDSTRLGRFNGFLCDLCDIIVETKGE